MGSKPFIAGDKITLADVRCSPSSTSWPRVKQPLSPDCKNLTAWFGRMKARPSAAA